jgi:hypothetical protein
VFGDSTPQVKTTSPHHGQFAMLLARRSYRDFNILSKGSKKLNKAFHRKGAGAVAHQCRDVRLLDAEDFSCIRLLEAPRLNEPVNLQCEPRFPKLLLRMREAEIGENISAIVVDRELFCIAALCCSHREVSLP